jgi:hypothetical protein
VPALIEAGIFFAMLAFALRQMTWLLLLPWLYAMTATLLRSLASLNAWSAEAFALAGGSAVAAIASRLFRPLWLIYVAGHELTHALWALLLGQRVTAIKIRKTGGHVMLSGTNSLITLAPYFFPLYGVVWLALADGLNRWTPLRVADWVTAFGFGGSYMLHLVMTAKVLGFRQPDIESEGYVFSAVVVLLGNLAMGLVLCPVALGLLRFRELASEVWINLGWCLEWVSREVGHLGALTRTF